MCIADTFSHSVLPFSSLNGFFCRTIEETLNSSHTFHYLSPWRFQTPYPQLRHLFLLEGFPTSIITDSSDTNPAHWARNSTLSGLFSAHFSLLCVDFVLSGQFVYWRKSGSCRSSVLHLCFLLPKGTASPSLNPASKILMKNSNRLTSLRSLMGPVARKTECWGWQPSTEL